ncbi:TPA: sigma-54-dependent Fis family transcriptional regulator, partial [Candidatus Marinimicrobia bacterium]|nr:sigma-54-dependent Fis family transcriptional regulator [Candidatus Neomarinimicrobiota bacterium]
MIEIEQKYGIIGKSDAIKEVISSIEQVAPTDISILISGESGTGKELVAQAIHRLSNRKNRPYIVVNCGAIPSGTIESELFGHKKGSFTGATEDRKGFFEAANQGTIFLDEIGELPQETQVKLLRVL